MNFKALRDDCKIGKKVLKKNIFFDLYYRGNEKIANVSKLGNYLVVEMIKNKCKE